MNAAAANSRIDALVDAAMPRLVEVTSILEFDTFQTASRVPRDLAALGSSAVCSLLHFP